MAEPIAALIVRILADTAEMVTGVKQVTGQLDTLENRVMKFGKGLAAGFTVGAITAFAKTIIDEAGAIDDAAKRVGAGAEEFQRFAFAIRESGIDMAAAEQNIAVLNVRLGSNDTGLLSVLRKLNISAEEFRARDPVQRYMDLGVALAGIADPAERAALRVEAMGMKGEKALAAIDQAFAEHAKDATVYSDQDIAALDAIGDAMDRLEGKARVAAASVALAIGRAVAGTAKGIFGSPTSDVGGSFGSAKVGGYDPRFVGPGLDQAPVPGSPLTSPASLPALGGVDPNDADALALALAQLSLEYTQVKARAEEAKEEFDATNWVLKTLKMEVTNLTGAMGPLMDAFGTTTKVDQFAQRIIDLAARSAELRREQERLLNVINPGSQKVAGDDVDAEIFKLRGDPRNFDKTGNLTPQALQLESDLLNTYSLRQTANQVQARNLVPTGNPRGFASVMNQVPSMSNLGSVVNPAPSNITIDARGSFWRDPQMMNELGRLVEDAIAGRGTGQYTRR